MNCSDDDCLTVQNTILNGQAQHSVINEFDISDAIQHTMVEISLNFVDGTDIKSKFDDFLNDKLKIDKTMEAAITVKTEIQKIYYNL